MWWPVAQTGEKLIQARVERKATHCGEHEDIALNQWGKDTAPGDSTVKGQTCFNSLEITNRINKTADSRIERRSQNILKGRKGAYRMLGWIGDSVKSTGYVLQRAWVQVPNPHKPCVNLFWEI